MRLGYVDRHRHWLEDQAWPLRKIGITVTTEVTWVQNPLEEILIHLKEQPMDVGRLGHRGMGKLIGSTVEHLLYKMPCSVWVVYTERLDE